MDVFILALILACFGSMALLLLWCDTTVSRKER